MYQEEVAALFGSVPVAPRCGIANLLTKTDAMMSGKSLPPPG